LCIRAKWQASCLSQKLEQKNLVLIRKCTLYQRIGLTFYRSAERFGRKKPSRVASRSMLKKWNKFRMAIDHTIFFNQCIYAPGKIENVIIISGTMVSNCPEEISIMTAPKKFYSYVESVPEICVQHKSSLLPFYRFCHSGAFVQL
jgi:hypothetical protein